MVNMTTHTKTHTMTPEQKVTEENLLKLAKVGHAAQALAIAAEANNLTPEELIDIVVALAKRELAK